MRNKNPRNHRRFLFPHPKNHHSSSRPLVEDSAVVAMHRRMVYPVAMNPRQEETTDEELAAAAQGNKEYAFGVLMERYQERLLQYGKMFLSDNDHIEDIVQDVFIKTYRNMRSFDVTRKFSPWIYRIAHNAFANALRKKHREPLVFVDFDTLVAHPAYERDPAQEEDRKEMRTLVDSGLEELPALYKEAIILYYIEDLSYQEIADVLHVPVGTVGVRLRRGREALKKIIKGSAAIADKNHAK